MVYVTYHLRTRDAILGHVCDFIMDAQRRAIEQWITKTGQRFSGKEVLFPAEDVVRIIDDESTLPATSAGKREHHADSLVSLARLGR